MPREVALGDLNGDGKPDLATVSVDDGTVSVLLNRGDGRFRAKRDYLAGERPTSVAIGDLNGDGKPDLATAHDDDAVSVLLNRGGGSFRTRRNYWGEFLAHSLAIGDLNGDRKPDLVTANDVSTVVVLLNRGGGSFVAKLEYRTGGSHSIAVGDLNGDGRTDLASGGANAVSVLFNTPGLCNVQDVKGETLRAAKRMSARVNCRVGTIRRGYSRWVAKGRVISQKPKFGAVLPGSGKVNLVVSRGRKR